MKAKTVINERLNVFHVDAFTDRLFCGNSAMVVILEKPLPDKYLQLIANENGLAETAFVMKDNDSFSLRWFTPEIEMDLCGHATLASAHVLFEQTNILGNIISFRTNSGIVTVFKEGSFYTMDFPARPATKTALPDIIRRGFDILPLETYRARDYILVYETEEDIKRIIPDRGILDTINLDPGGICITAKGEDVDFVSRFFTPQASIFEDPVTGSAHCSLVPFWAERLNKNNLFAKQLSKRGGELICMLNNARVLLKGQAQTYMTGIISVDFELPMD